MEARVLVDGQPDMSLGLGVAFELAVHLGQDGPRARRGLGFISQPGFEHLRPFLIPLGGNHDLTQIIAQVVGAFGRQGLAGQACLKRLNGLIKTVQPGVDMAQGLVGEGRLVGTDFGVPGQGLQLAQGLLMLLLLAQLLSLDQLIIDCF